MEAKKATVFRSLLPTFLFAHFVLTYLRETINSSEVEVPKMRHLKHKVYKLFYTKFIETSCVFVTVKQGKESHFHFQKVEEGGHCYVVLL